ncbi:Transmembrane and coiled-coil domain-containing protein 7 [Fasciola gigantica]|uniref:Transmembrane and coiled-coil domain-containing protein 7 n=1 Tax=Fasciola gigantica TaxID=46835 RepID=A0A504YNX0_FASGI|nr:Transmembrane and coiled-coil domain-containing protein 7 [Fasciola gigantica]
MFFSFRPSNVHRGEKTNVIVNRPLIEECREPSEALEQSAVDTNSSEESLNPVLAEVFEQLDDFLIPVRGHALIMLSRLLESRDACVRGHEERIFQILVRQLNDKDSYIYLNAIRALSAMGLVMTDRVLHILLNKFSQPLPAGTFPVDARVEFQLKLGEAIMRVLRELGESFKPRRLESDFLPHLFVWWRYLISQLI